jgi:hypothetical protein
MTPKLSLADLMRCKKHEHETITNFISWYQSIYSQIDVKIPDLEIQKMFIENLKLRFKII